MIKEWAVRWMTLSVLVLAGCATPLTNHINTGYQLAEQYTDRTGRLIDEDLIDQDTAIKRQTNSKVAKRGLDASKDIHKNCKAAGVADVDCLAAWAQADGAHALLREVEVYLLKKAKEGN
jgi:hypothetical protein